MSEVHPGHVNTPEIWDGTCTWQEGITPFAFYDSDRLFQTDAVKVSKWVAKRLGWPLMDVELQSGSIFACFEEAVTTYGNIVYEYKIRENYLSLEGGSTSIDVNNTVVEPTLQRMIQISKMYGTEAEVGGDITLHHDQLWLKPGVQEYDLNEWAEKLGIEGGIEIRKIFYEAPPAILRYFDPYAGTGTGIQSLMDAFDFGSYSPGVNFLLMPISHDLLQIQAIEFNDQVRKSAYSFRISNNILQIFPIPHHPGYLRIEYYKLSDKRKLNAKTSRYATMSTHKMKFNVKLKKGSDCASQTFVHNLGTKDVTVQAYEQVVENGKVETRQFIPYKVEVVDENTITVSFAENTKGFLVIGYPESGVEVEGQSRKVLKAVIDFELEVPKGARTNSCILTHNLGTQNIQVQAFQDFGTKSNLFYPDEIKILNDNQIRISVRQSTVGHVVISHEKLELTDDASEVIANITQVPYENPVYSKINSVGRQWIFRYTLALCKEVLAYIRGKYSTLPTPQPEVTLNQGDLLTDARQEKQDLETKLREMLEITSRANQLELKSKEAEYLRGTLSGVPMLIWVG